jgi:hypothetical protein
MTTYIPPNSYQVQQLSEAYEMVSEKEVLNFYFDLCSRRKYAELEPKDMHHCLDLVRVVLWKKRIPSEYAQLLIETFDVGFYRSRFLLQINTFAKLRLCYDYYLHPWDRSLINQRYKTLAIMTDPKMNVIKHTLELLYLKLFGWRFW